jgi:hypothetical protein
MGIVNWRREGLFLAIAGMETCWMVAWSRNLLDRPGAATTGPSWWSVWILFIVALIAARSLGRLELPRGRWYIAALALGTSLFLVWVNLGSIPLIAGAPTDLSKTVEILILLLGLLVWFRAPGIVLQAGDTRSMARHFQIGLLILVGAVLVTRCSEARATDLVVGYFGWGLLAIALTRIEEVARTESGSAAPFNLKWMITLATTLLVAGIITSLATQVLTVETVRWLLRPVTILLSVVLFAFLMVATELVALLVPLLRWIFPDISAEALRDATENLREPRPSLTGEEVDQVRLLSPQLEEVLVNGLIVLVILVALWLAVRAFRNWRTRQYATPGAVRETVAHEGRLAEDLADFLRDRWRRLRELDLRGRWKRLGIASARAIYGNLLALLAAAGHPRQPEQTPYEYEPVAGEVLPTRQAEIRAITDAYVRARYGELEISGEELARLQEAWKDIEREGERL